MPRSDAKSVRIRPTPYDRSPNWLSSAWKIAEGAGRVMRSVLSSHSDSSSSSTSFGTDLSSSSDADDDEVHMDGSCPDALQGNQKNDELNEAAQGLYPELMQWTSETKRAIVMLLMQETFSREECECLVDIVNSRNIDSSVSVNVQEKKPNKAVGPDVRSTDVCCNALMEARKWMYEYERKLGSDSISVSPSSVTSCNYSCSSSPYMQNTRKFSSPVEIARTYMNGRPPSPIESLAAYKTLQSRRIKSLWEGSPGPIRGKSLSCSEDLPAVLARDVTKKDPQSEVIVSPQNADALNGRSAHIILTRRSLTMALDSQADSILSEQTPQNRVATSMSNDNEVVGVCKFASESLVEIPSNDICF